MAAPVLQGTTAFLGSGTSVSIPATATSPVAGDYRLMVVHTNDRASSGAPVSVTPPAGWTLLYQSPRGRSTIRIWVFGQKWNTSVVTGDLTLSSNVYYAVTLGRVSGYTLTGAHPVITTPATAFGTGGSLTAGNLYAQGDSLRLDFWAAFYASNANVTSTTINVPVGQTGATVFRASTTQGYVVRVTSETRAVKGYTSSRTATMTPAGTNAVLSLAVGGWKVVSQPTTTTMGLAPSSVGRKAVTLATATALATAGSGAGSGRLTTVATATALALESVSQRVYLTRTDLALTSESAGTHASTGQPVTVLALAGDVAGTHTSAPVDSSTTLGLVSTVAARVGGGGAPPSLVDQYTVQYVPSSKPLRFMFQSIRTGEWLNWDVPIVEPEITYQLSGATLIRGKLGPEDYAYVEKTIDAWGTWVHAEEGGQIRASAIMQPFAIQGDDLMIEALGVHGYAVGTQFESEFSAIQIDPAEVVRQLWAYLQSYPDAKFGLTLDATATPRRLGDPARVDIRRDANGDVVYRVLKVDEETGLFRVNQGDISDAAWLKLLQQGYPLYQDTQTGQLVQLVRPNDLAMATTGLPARRNADGEWEVPEYTNVEAKPYEIAWWNQIDVGREIENLAKQTPFDFAESPRWKANRLDVQQHLAIGYPRLGTRRHDLRFAEDENLLEAALLRETPGHYASQVIVRGAGEGRAAIRAQAGVPNPNRVRRVTSITDKTITDRVRAQALANEELLRRLAAQTISEITIDATHPNAPMGSFALGDDILVQARLPYFGEVALWHRITGYTWRPDADLVVLKLQRSEQFAYGRVVTA